ncbi:LysR family transcriptional regulator [Pseudomonas sp. 13B_2.1_Bac1]|uniref:LysR family transcriptional regulator n=1 Tax=Pseudomonas sp. 13B_2.1_Bac1 TaxID=2971624 RepID=UPI0021C91BAA|nr:LysR family transcriptional regulator [Pseudomonas sp. 13B_2.1_Bac1]MCU1785194.1 LysR family transcriptional regulator [Pseudomonas sp. 13B_2.1_Bac1]
MDRLKQIELFVLIAELGSVSSAAERLAISNAAASRYLSALEGALGTRLVERTTRRLWVKEAGARFLHGARMMLLAYQEAEAAVAEVSVAPSGLLRVTSSLSFAMQHLAPTMLAFRQRYPALRIDVVVANRYPDFGGNQADSMCCTWLPGATWQARNTGRPEPTRHDDLYLGEHSL